MTDPEPTTDADREQIGECAGCGIPIYIGEWHAEDRPESDAPTKWCLPCSDTNVDELADDQQASYEKHTER